MIQAMHPHIDLADSIVRIFGIPGILAGLIWLVRTYDKGAHQMKEIRADTVETRMLACTSCHGLHGQGTNDVHFPRLAGKPAGYLYNQLTAFRNGRGNRAGGCLLRQST